MLEYRQSQLLYLWSSSRVSSRSLSFFFVVDNCKFWLRHCQQYIIVWYRRCLVQLLTVDKLLTVYAAWLQQNSKRSVKPWSHCPTRLKSPGVGHCGHSADQLSWVESGRADVITAIEIKFLDFFQKLRYTLAAFNTCIVKADKRTESRFGHGQLLGRWCEYNNRFDENIWLNLELVDRCIIANVWAS